MRPDPSAVFFLDPKLDAFQVDPSESEWVRETLLLPNEDGA